MGTNFTHRVRAVYLYFSLKFNCTSYGSIPFLYKFMQRPNKKISSECYEGINLEISPGQADIAPFTWLRITFHRKKSSVRVRIRELLEMSPSCSSSDWMYCNDLPWPPKQGWHIVIISLKTDAPPEMLNILSQYIYQKPATSGNSICCLGVLLIEHSRYCFSGNDMPSLLQSKSHIKCRT